MPLPTPSQEELKDQNGKNAFIGRCMQDPAMIKEFENEKQQAAICYHQYAKSKEKMAQGSLAKSLNQPGITNCLVKIKTNALKETALFQENAELAANYLKKSGLKRLASWYLAVDPNKEETDPSRYSYCFSSDFQNVDISALENIMEVAASVDDKDLANKASDLLTLALKKKNGESLSTFTFFPGPHSVTLEASI